MTTIHTLDPLTDPRWVDFVARHPRASVFHTRGWLQALRGTFGYRPVVYTTTPPGTALADGIVLCTIRSWITGRRLVSLPFSDHCEPLVEGDKEFATLLDGLEADAEEAAGRYIEIRPRSLRPPAPTRLGPSRTFAFHAISLEPSLGDIFDRLHKSCIQRKIRRAEREKVRYDEGRSEALQAQFYTLLLTACRRRRQPPHPRAWFRTVAERLGDAVKIRVASKDGVPIAAIVTLSFRNAIVYKYGCSDDRFHGLGGMQLLLWRAIEDGKRLGAAELDLGRSDPEDAGLIAFKDRWGSVQSALTYWRRPDRPAAFASPGWRVRCAQAAFARVPAGVLETAGRILYRHVG